MISAGRVLLMPKGAYNPSTTYEILDIVSYNGSSYIAKGTTTGNLPTDTTYWQLSAYGGQASNMAGNFAELEVTSVASMTHYADDIFVDENSQLMKATQTINIGDTIDVNTNCTPTTVEALISYLSSYVDSLDSLNKKIQGAIEIAAQTDLHSLAIGEYYKKQSTFYITNGPTGIDQDPTAIFRLTVEAALDNASQASSPLLLTLRTPDGKIYTQGFDGTIWGSWKQIADKSSLDAIEARVDAVEDSVADVETSSTASKAYAIGESFYYNDVLYKATAAITQGGTITPETNCTPEKIIEKIDDLVSENQTLTNNLSDEVETRAKLGAHNLFDSKRLAQASPSGGITFTVSDDGSLSITGGTTSAYFQPYDSYVAKDVRIPFKPNTSYIFSIGEGKKQENIDLKVYYKATPVSSWTVLQSASNVDEMVFTTPASFYDIIIRPEVSTGKAITTTTLYPLVKLASDSFTAYAPYAKSNQELTAENQTLTKNLDDEIETRAKLGAHNRLPLNLATIKSLNTSGTWSGNDYTVNNVTFTVNDDFTITANTSGAASATAFLALASNIEFKAEDYILSAGSSVDGQYSKYGLYLQKTGQSDITTADYTKKHFVLSTDTVFTNCKIFVANGESVTNLVFKPMVTLSSDPSTAYAPYAMTNRELTESLIGTKRLLATVNTTNVTEQGYGINYVVKNGVCYVSANSIIMKTTGNSVVVASGLPKAKMFVTALPVTPDHANPAPNNSFFITNGGTDLKCNADNTTIANYFSFSYPIE